MFQNIPVEILATIIGLVGGLIGYAIREYLNRSRPFYHLTRVDGGTIRKADTVLVSEDILTSLTDTFFDFKLQSETTLANIDDRLTHANEVVNSWPGIEKKIQQLEKCQQNEDFIEHLYEVFELSYFREIAFQLLVRDKISIASPDRDKEEVIQIYDDDENEGCVWIWFPEHATKFGRNLKMPAVRAKCQRFLDCIRVGDCDKLLTLFRSIHQIMQREYQSALRVQQLLTALRNENSRWVFHAYFANLGHMPVIIQKDTQLIINDPKTGVFREKCYLAVVREGNIEDIATPLVVKAGEDASVCFITDNIQRTMDLGKAIRESFDRGKAACRVKIRVFRVGLFPNQEIWSMPLSFKE